MIPTSPSAILPMQDLLYDAATLACRAPSVANSQPWRWRIHRDTLELRADPLRQLAITDPDGQMMVVSCGAALHHAAIALAALGAEAELEHIVDPADPYLLGRFRVVDGHEATARDTVLLRALQRRCSDRRPFQSTSPVSSAIIEQLTTAAARFGVGLHTFARQDTGFIALAARAAAMIERRDPAYQAEMLAWTTQRNRGAGEGVPTTSAVPQVARAVPVRDFAPGAEARLAPGPGDDQFTTYLAFITPADTRTDWLHTGEALSAVLLDATLAGLASSVMSDVIEVPGAKSLLRGIVATTAFPQLMVRLGTNDGAVPIPESPRRPPADVIVVD